MKIFQYLMFTVSVLMLVSGCGGKKAPDLVEVAGTVVANGQPLPQVEVRFMPEPKKGEVYDAPQPSVAITDENGQFSLRYQNKPELQGAVIGPHRITMDDILHHESRDNPIPFRFSQSLVNAAKTPLTFEVKEGGDTSVTLDITEYMLGGR